MVHLPNLGWIGMSSSMESFLLSRDGFRRTAGVAEFNVKVVWALRGMGGVCLVHVNVPDSCRNTSE